MDVKKKSSKDSDDSLLDYIKINQKNVIEELTSKDYITVTSNLLKSFSIIEDHIGSEINSFFNIILPESKENDPLKMNTLIASKSKVDNSFLENCLTDILNRPELNYVILTKELSEQLSTIIKEIYRKIKKKYIKNFEQLIEESKKFWENNGCNDILKKYRNDKIKSIKTINENETMIFNNNNMIKKFQLNNEQNIKDNKTSKLLNKNIIINIKNKNYEQNENELFYKFKKLKDDNSYNLPVEMLILIRKFSFVKRLKLVLNNEIISDDNENIFRLHTNTTSNTTYNNSIISNDGILEKSDIQNSILVFLNLEWLFPNVVEIDVDLTCEGMSEYLMNNVYLFDLKIFSEIFKRESKLTILPINSYNKRNYDQIPSSLFSIVNTHPSFEEYSSDKFSSSMTSNNVNNINYSVNLSQININNQLNPNYNTNFQSQEGKIQKNFDNFLKKYNSFLEMIVIYGYFIQKKMPNIIKANFTIPINLSYEISKLLKKQNVIIENFHFFSFINNQNIKHTTIDFNSLDNQTFEKVLNFLNKNQQMNNCNISFFPPEEYFKSEILLKTLQICDEKYKIHKNRFGIYSFDENLLIDIYPSEDIDNYILRKLSKFFEKNLSDFFHLITIKTSISDLALFFDIPNILIQNGIYNNILLKFFINIFIFINNTLNNIRTLSIIAENFIFDKRKHQILYDFLESLKFNDINQEFKLLNLTFQVRMFHINNIYRLLSFNLTYLSIGSLDYITFNSFVNYFSSENFREKSKLVKLKITLNNTVYDIKNVYNDMIKLFNKFPKKMDEISFYSSLSVSYKQLKYLLMMTNYNQLLNIFMLFNIKSINGDKKLEELLENDLFNFESGNCITMENMIDLYRVKRNKIITNKIINLLVNLKKKNSRIMDYKMYSNIERFLCINEKKNVIIQFKS